MIMQYLMNIYDYLINLISLSSSRPTIKHKDSEDISENDVEEISPENNSTHESKILPIASRSKTHVPFGKYPIYQCGHCGNSIKIPQYLFQDMVFRSIMCRTHNISLVQNTKQNTCV